MQGNLHKHANMTTWIRAFFNLIFPQQCVVCNRLLSHAEEYMCTVCNIGMPRTHYHLQKDNFIEKLFWGQIPIERATTFFFYQKGNSYCNIIHELKYRGGKHIGQTMGRYMANEMQGSGFFEDIDVIIPIPLHTKKLRKRGYNQSEWIAMGVSDITRIPIDNKAIVRKTYTESQTKQSASARLENVRDAFEALRPEQFAGKHILLVDDVLTTGATIIACASTLSHIEGVRFSVIALSVSH